MGKTISSLLLLPPILVLFCICLQFVTAVDTITPSKSIKDPEFIVSQGGVFRLGFFNFANSTNRYVGIWYNQIPVQTVIWVANRNKPLKDSSGILKISETGNLVVSNGQEEILWSSNVTNLVGSNTSALLLDSGNLVLKNEDENRTTIWESFQHPSNGYLPDMKLSTNLRTGQKVKLSSWKSPSDPSEGNFSLTLEPLNIPEVVVWNNNQPYFRSGPWNDQIFIGISVMNSIYPDGFTIVPDDQRESFYLSYQLKSLFIYYEFNSQGKVVERHWNGAKGDWVSYIVILENECDVYGKCGAFGSCDSMKARICSCLKGFEPKNTEEWNRQNWTSGCVRTTPLLCQNPGNGSAKNDGFLKLKNMKVPAFAEWTPEVFDDSCRIKCLNNCSCMAYAYDVGIGCMLWSGDLIDIQKFQSGGVDLNIRLPSSELDKKDEKSKVIAIITVIAAIIIIFIIVLWIWAKSRGRKDKVEINMGNLPLFKFEELATATNNFDITKKLGQGGFGPVYKGTLQDGKEIAVKRLSRASGQGLDEFMNEVVVISKLQGENACL